MGTLVRLNCNQNVMKEIPSPDYCKSKDMDIILYCSENKHK